MAENKQTAKPDFDENQITEKELQKYEQHYSDASFLEKATKYGKLIGINALYKAVQLWFVMQKPDVPAGTKAVIMGALGYLIVPWTFYRICCLFWATLMIWWPSPLLSLRCRATLMKR